MKLTKEIYDCPVALGVNETCGKTLFPVKGQATAFLSLSIGFVGVRMFALSVVFHKECVKISA